MTLYRTHGVVIADHWGDMAREGFLANRLFDAVASGAGWSPTRCRGSSVFDGAVQAYTSLDDLRSALRSRTAAIGSPATRRWP